jgi:hypothetical protein
MEDATRVTLRNRTGMQRSPIQSQEMLDSVSSQPVPELPDPEHDGLAEVRAEYLAEADPLGTIPAPLTASGMVQSAVQMLTGNRMQVFIDKLAERAAFERSGSRLYDALISKQTGEIQANGHGADGSERVSHETLLGIRNDETRHFLMLSDCIEQLGADPTAVTPCADVAGIQSIGLVQTVSDPRTTLAQSLGAILTAELVDGAAWQLLVELAEAMKQDEMVTQFRAALADEARHLQIIRDWHTALVLGASGNAPDEDVEAA